MCMWGQPLSRVWLCNPMDCSPANSSVHRILLARLQLLYLQSNCVNRSLKTHTNPFLKQQFLLLYLPKRQFYCASELFPLPFPFLCTYENQTVQPLAHSFIQTIDSEWPLAFCHILDCLWGIKVAEDTELLHNADPLETDKKSQWATQPVERGTQFQGLQHVLGRPGEDAWMGDVSLPFLQASQGAWSPGPQQGPSSPAAPGPLRSRGSAGHWRSRGWHWTRPGPWRSPCPSGPRCA